MNIAQIVKVTKADAFSFLLFFFPLILFAMAMVSFIFGDLSISRSFGRTMTLDINSSAFYVQLAFLLAPFSILSYILRVKFIINTLNSGKKVVGIVSDVNFTKDRGYITYKYKIGRHVYQATNKIMKFKLTESFTCGDKVTICYNTKNPKQAFIQNIYR